MGKPVIYPASVGPNARAAHSMTSLLAVLMLGLLATVRGIAAPTNACNVKLVKQVRSNSLCAARRPQFASTIRPQFTKVSYRRFTRRCPCPSRPSP